jgi:hypothetical protein
VIPLLNGDYGAGTGYQIQLVTDFPRFALFRDKVLL